MAWAKTKARVNALPMNLLVESDGGTLDVMVCTVTSEHGEVEIIGPHILPTPKAVKRMAKMLSKRPKGDPLITHDSDVVMVVRQTKRVYRDSWPLPPRSL